MKVIRNVGLFLLFVAALVVLAVPFEGEQDQFEPQIYWRVK